MTTRYQDTSADKLPAITDDERRRIVALGRTSRPPGARPRLIHEMLSEVAQAAPDAVAVTGEGIRLTYRELDERAGRIARVLTERRVRPGDLVGVCVSRAADVPVLLLGVLAAGGAYVPLEPSYPAQRLAFVAEDARLALLIADQSVPDLASQTPVLPYERLSALAEAAEPAAGPALQPDSIAYVIYTSGSTGQPKGVAVQHRNVTALIAAGQSLFRLGADDVWTWFHSAAFDFSVWEIFGCLLTGGRLVMVPESARRSPPDFCRLLADEQVTVLSQTPSSFMQLISAERAAPRALAPRLVVCGGEPLNTGALLPWLDRHPESACQLVNMYGITETTVHVTAQTITRQQVEHASASVGRAIPGWSVRIVDTAGQVLPLGATGEIAVAGDGLALGYLHRSELTASRFVADRLTGERLYLSGDRGRMGTDGSVEHLGRLDRQVKVRGYRIELDEIQAVLSQDDTVAESAVILSQDSPDVTIVGYVVFADGAPASTVELRRRIAARLPSYMLPDTITELSALPLTSNGKLDVGRLPRPGRPERSAVHPGPAGMGGRAADLQALRAEVRAAWESALGHQEFANSDSFFIVGGNSIKAIRVISRLASEVGIRLPVQLLFEHQTVDELAAAIKEVAGSRPG